MPIRFLKLVTKSSNFFIISVSQLSLLLPMLGCMDGLGVVAQNRTIPQSKMHANRQSSLTMVLMEL